MKKKKQVVTIDELVEAHLRKQLREQQKQEPPSKKVSPGRVRGPRRLDLRLVPESDLAKLAVSTKVEAKMHEFLAKYSREQLVMLAFGDVLKYLPNKEGELAEPEHWAGHNITFSDFARTFEHRYRKDLIPLSSGGWKRGAKWG
jgi:hypothetical protein